jgi:hypothetical protein
MKRLEKIFRPFEKMSQLVANPHNHLEKAKTHAIRKIYTEIDLFDCPYAEGAGCRGSRRYSYHHIRRAGRHSADRRLLDHFYGGAFGQHLKAGDS